MSVLEQLKNREETFWQNPHLDSCVPGQKINGYGYAYLKAAQNRFMRFLPCVAKLFPETAAKMGVIESPLYGIPDMQEYLNQQGACIEGKLFLKDDGNLPIAGSVKARGGIHEVMKHAETLAHKAGMLEPTDNYGKIASQEFHDFYQQYTVQVGSTGNLGISIGRMAARLGFRVVVHMSSDAKQWKKDLLRSEGVTVKEYDGDYSQAVAQGRAESEADPFSYFVDDEKSEDLFFGYSTAALRLKVQLRKGKVIVDEDHPLFVYIPCGVGGAPGGITFGLRQALGDNVHCFFAEPVDAPCFTLGMATDRGGDICVQDIGLTGHTIADGLAVGRASYFVCDMMDSLVSGSFTVTDDKMRNYERKLWEIEELFAEPSACAGFGALEGLMSPGSAGEAYLREHNLMDKMKNASHVVWSTGGGLMPEEERLILLGQS